MRYRPEVDGIRALAVVPVILFHAGVPGFAGGYVGVDIFFVISGYLITRLINDEIERGEFSLIRFYERRARRILPALFLMCIVCIPFARAWYPPDEYETFGKALLAVVGFISNLYLWQQVDYFAAPAETLPLFHTWSLAVEEQFYILFPLLLLALNRHGRAHKTAWLLAISAASLGIAVLIGAEHPSANFYLLPSRAWELGCGALLALSGDELPGIWTRWKREIVALLGATFIGASIWLFTTETRHPGFMTLLPVLGTVALILAATPQTLVGRVLSHRALVGVGLISYSAYLWHQPLFSFARTYIGKLQPTVISGLIVATFVLAWLSWRFVEQPFRNRHTVTRTQVFRLGTVVSFAIAAVGVLAIVTDGTTGRPSEAVAANSWAQDRSPSYNACISRVGRPIDVSRSCVYGLDTSGPKLAIIGDSQAATIAHRLAEAIADTGWPMIELTRAACPPAAGLEIRSRLGAGCSEFNAAAARRLQEGDIEIVVMLARWSQYIHDEPFDNGEGGSLPYVSRALPVGFAENDTNQMERQEAVGRQYVGAVSTLLEQGKRVVLVYPIPEVGWNVPQELARRRKAGGGSPEVVSTDHRVFLARHAVTYAAFDRIPDSPRLIRVKPETQLCNVALNGRCVAEVDGQPLYWDDSHLNESLGAPLVAREVYRALSTVGWLRDRRALPDPQPVTGQEPLAGSAKSR